VSTYTAYGLCIRSVLPLPELGIPTEGEPDVVIRLGKTGGPAPETDHTGRHFHLDDGEATLYWRQIGAFRVRCGREIVVEPSPGVAEETLRLPLLGMVLGVLLQQRGLLALHASAVAVNGAAVAFLGEKGQGKSTTAAALYTRGHSLVADDLLALEIGGAAGPIALPGYPHFKLWPDAAVAALGEDPEAMPRLEAGYEKRGRRVADRFAGGPLPLRRIYCLRHGPAPAIEPFPLQEALVHLISHSFLVRVFQECLPRQEAAANLLRCASLVRQAPLSWLKRPRCLEALPELARCVEADLS
jgi:hypothetical protein